MLARVTITRHPTTGGPEPKVSVVILVSDEAGFIKHGEASAENTMLSIMRSGTPALAKTKAALCSAYTAQAARPGGGEAGAFVDVPKFMRDIGRL